MPRELVIGNGKIEINFDKHYHMRDLYFPRVGKENHLQAGMCRFGVFCEGKFSWIHDPVWEKNLDYLADTLVTQVVFYNAQLQLKITCNDCTDFHRPIYLRRILIENLATRDREVRLFFHHDFNISENSVGDTAYFRPDDHSLVHYKGDRYFFMNCCNEAKSGWDQFATGSKGRESAEGTWRDAEDGMLGGNPIAQGSVDSVGALHCMLKSESKYHAAYWIAMGSTYPEVRELNIRLLNKSFDELVNRTINFWRMWINKEDCSLGGLPEPITRLYKKSLLILRTHVDEGGAVIAATDSDVLKFNRDTYCYMWPRDGALTAYAADKAFYPGLSVPFYYFCRRTITTGGFMLHKYNPDESLGSSWHPWVEDHQLEALPIQEDGTSLVIWALWHHFERYRDVEMLKDLYRPLVVRAGNFMRDFRDPKTGLPAPCYDLWEERRGIFSFTVGSVYGGLQGAAYFAKAFGETALSDSYLQAAREIKEATDRHLWCKEEKRFLRGLLAQDHDLVQDKTIDASIFGLFYFGMYEADDPRIVSTMEAIKERLWVKTPIGGIARYENDSYYQVDKDTNRIPGNPWVISTLWYAQWIIQRAKESSELTKALEMMQWVVDRTSESGVLSEQFHPVTGEPLSVCPLTWSHGTFVLTVLEYAKKRDELKKQEEINLALHQSSVV